ncbi:hypothetical protein IFM89_009278 [Coptis chinensis]|uniref:Glycosyl hydrolase family 32 N-terminal domain-containing protein n=1 Tax=Coptis chinensis TaxID=261450 RepID=A0A835I1L9_9MAGN|nr:hypothetical protein IFM89_009278 [Coptis chinensis]
MPYTGSTNESVQVQNLAYPADPSDPLLLDWVKYAGNPILVPPPGIGMKDFHDTPPLHALHQMGIGESRLDQRLTKPEYPLSTKQKTSVRTYGLDTSVNGPGVKHVLRASLDDDKHDYYALGSYDAEKDVWTPDDSELDVGIGLRYDYGKFYASKTFYDQNKERRILWGWTGETDSELADIQKGWASVQTVPRVVLFDDKTKTNVLQWPVKELDITAEFEVDKKALGVMEADVGYNCSTGNGAAGRSTLGPFGLLVLANEARSEQTTVYFYIAKAMVT